MRFYLSFDRKSNAKRKNDELIEISLYILFFFWLGSFGFWWMCMCLCVLLGDLDSIQRYCLLNGCIRLCASNFEINKCSRCNSHSRAFSDRFVEIKFFCVVVVCVRGIELNLWMHKNATITTTSTTATTTKTTMLTTRRRQSEHLFLLLNFRLCGFHDMALKSKLCFRWASMHRNKEEKSLYERIKHIAKEPRKQKPKKITHISLPRTLLRSHSNSIWLISFSIFYISILSCQHNYLFKRFDFYRCNAERISIDMADVIQLCL